MIEVKNINHSYGYLKTLKDINLTIKDHKITAIIGGNGAGKSTLISIIGRLLEPNSGVVEIHNQNIQNQSQKDSSKIVSILRQTQNLNLKVTVEELIAFGRYPHSKGRLTDNDKDIIQKSIEYLDLISIKDKYIDELSGGQRQRAYLAMILAQDTEYLLLDEPLNNLDIKYSMETMQILKRLVTELNKTVVIVLHDINIAAIYADEIIALKDGEVVCHDMTSRVIEKETLQEIFDYEFEVIDKDGKKICLYNCGKERGEK